MKSAARLARDMTQWDCGWLRRLPSGTWREILDSCSATLISNLANLPLNRIGLSSIRLPALRNSCVRRVSARQCVPEARPAYKAGGKDPMVLPLRKSPDMSGSSLYLYRVNRKFGEECPHSPSSLVKQVENLHRFAPSSTSWVASYPAC